ncbi:MAG: hypothetical protein JXB26_13870 [Candidatus Aminicenantes bacterium]|nr:hypothetical protein [Candidatus Aminicenantes bacterium]
MKKHLFFSFVLFLVFFSGCKSPNYSGLYYVTFGPNPVYTMDIDHVVDGTYASFVLKGWGIEISGEGSIVDKTMTMTGSVPNFGTVTISAAFSEEKQSFSGTWFFDGAPINGTITGTKNNWTVFDVDKDPLPFLGTGNCIELDKIKALSKFRSGEGHDYSDDFEGCRSMKHYYLPKDSVDMSSVKVFAPASGKVIGTVDEYENNGLLWKGTAIGIQPDGYDAFCFVLYHVNLNVSLEVGDRVMAGQELGKSEKKTGTVMDIALWVHTSAGHKLLSYFEVMSDGIFQLYVNRGMISRNDVIITKEERDADPLDCIGEQFVGPGHLENWFFLE